MNYHKSLLVFFRWCAEEGYIEKNHVINIETPKIVRRLPKKLSNEDAVMLLEVTYNYPYKYKFLRYRNHAIFATFIYADLRKSELFNLKLTDVDIENQTIFINKGKGSKDRFIPISHTLAKSLNRYLKERIRLKKTTSFFYFT